MTALPDRADLRLLDEEVRDTPRRLTAADVHAYTGAGWRRGASAPDDPEDER